MFYLAVIGVNCVYILAELIFNVQLINVASTDATIEEINNIEIFGRALSTIGLSLLLTKIIFATVEKGAPRIFALSLVALMAYPVFYVGQKELVDYLAESTTHQQQQEYYNTFLAKKSMLYDGFEDPRMTFFEERGVEEKVFLSNIGVLKNVSNIAKEVEQFEENERRVVNSTSEALAQKIYNEYKEFVFENDVFFEKYESTVRDYYQDKRKLKRYGVERYEELTSPSGKKRFYDLYKEVMSKVRKGRQFIELALPNQVRTSALRVGSCTTQECLDKRVSNFENTQVNLAKNHLGKYGERMPLIGFYEACSFEPHRPTRGRTTINYIEDGRQKRSSMNNHLNLFKDSHTKLKCFFNLDEMEAMYLSKFNDIVKNELQIEDENIRNQKDFVNSIQFRNFILMASSEEDGDYYLPRNWHYTEKEVFMDAFVGDKLKELENEYRQEIERELGHDLGFSATERDFRGSDFLKDKFNEGLEKNQGINVEHANDFSSFYQKNKENFDELAVKNLKEFDFEKQGADIVKIMIIPPIAMGLSLFFTIFNALLFIRYLLKEHKVPPYAIGFILFSLSMMVALAPYTVSVEEGQKMLINDIGNTSLLFQFVYDWVVRMEIMFYNMAQPLNNIFLSWL